MSGTTLLSVEMLTGELVVSAIELLQRGARCERREQAFHGRHMQENNVIESELSEQNTTGCMSGTTLLSVETREIRTGELIQVAIEHLQLLARCERWQRAFSGRHM